jgi:sec-independent protein translocase protein TatA
VPGLIGIQEIVLVIVVLTLVFGVKRLPEIGRSLGHGMREFKDGITGRTRHDLDADRRHPSR